MRIVAQIIITAISVVNSSLQPNDKGPKLQFKETIFPGGGGLITIEPQGTDIQFESWGMPVGRPSRDFALLKADLIKSQDMILHFEKYLNDPAVNALAKKILTRAALLKSEDMDFIYCGGYVGAVSFQTNTIQDPKSVCATFQLIKEYATRTMGPRLVMSIANRHLTVSFDSGNEIQPVRVSDLKSWVFFVPHQYDIEAVENITQNNIDRLIVIADHLSDPAVVKDGFSFNPFVKESTGAVIIECGEVVGTVTLTKSEINYNDAKNYCGYLLNFTWEIRNAVLLANGHP